MIKRIKLVSGLFIVVSIKAFQFAVRTDSEWAPCLSLTVAQLTATHQAGTTWLSAVRCLSCTHPNIKSSFNF